MAPALPPLSPRPLRVRDRVGDSSRVRVRERVSAGARGGLGFMYYSPNLLSLKPFPGGGCGEKKRKALQTLFNYRHIWCHPIQMHFFFRSKPTEKHQRVLLPQVEADGVI